MYVRFLYGAPLVTCTRCVLIDLTSALLCGCILVYTLPPPDVSPGSRSKQSSSSSFLHLWKVYLCIAVRSPSFPSLPDPRSSIESSLYPLLARSTCLGDIDLVRCRPSGFYGGQRGFIISIEYAHGNVYALEEQPWKCLFQVMSSYVSLMLAQVFSVLILGGVAQRRSRPT